MKKFPPRFFAPIDLTRPRGARILEAFSPKLGRTVRYFDRAAFEYWVGLEADPDVEVFCERPVRFPAAEGNGTADFWVRSHKGEAILLLGSRDAASSAKRGRRHPCSGGRRSRDRRGTSMGEELAANAAGHRRCPWLGCPGC